MTYKSKIIDRVFFLKTVIALQLAGYNVKAVLYSYTSKFVAFSESLQFGFPFFICRGLSNIQVINIGYQNWRNFIILAVY